MSDAELQPETINGAIHKFHSLLKQHLYAEWDQQIFGCSIDDAERRAQRDLKDRGDFEISQVAKVIVKGREGGSKLKSETG